MFTNIVARWPGSTHDSFVFSSSLIGQRFESQPCTLEDGLLLGDSGYPCKPYLMTPYLNPTSVNEEAFNQATKSYKGGHWTNLWMVEAKVSFASLRSKNEAREGLPYYWSLRHIAQHRNTEEWTTGLPPPAWRRPASNGPLSWLREWKGCERSHLPHLFSKFPFLH